MTSSSLSVFQLAIYSLLSLPILFILSRHGTQGLLGWAYLFVFCSLRIVGSALQISNPQGTGASIIANIGLSPLLLATLGLIHEAYVPLTHRLLFCGRKMLSWLTRQHYFSRYFRNPSLKPSSEWLYVIALHVLVAAAVALIADGASALANGTASWGDVKMLRAGMFVLLLCWIIFVVMATLSALPSQKSINTHASSSGTKV